MPELTPGRRRALKRTAAILTGLGTAVGIGYAGSRPSAALEADDRFLAEDVRVERNDGELDAVTIEPTFELAWADFGGGVETVEMTVSAALEGEGGFDVLFDAPVTDGAVTVDGNGFDRTDGTATIALDRFDLTATGSAVTLGDFGGDLAPGASKTTGVELTIRIDVVGAQSETVTTVETASFGVTVHNPEGETSTVGRANTDAT
ncbi:uncharacterized protein Nmlp_3109 [Natronomonas moolapensis 8.8.11]|uniref:Uncharacterized protein n=1 Tax=Natronomonas moolapensis (strain DSM 18674 / CECT 7526 / JCM 14361 / 8.8.11) TaxID=268739 RepID=M1XSB8_NATM8|nr:hypothetical protein [Natronomonas moolapensis]CCQ37251.1 uncharacterized protein Nmlp_3109 [Natronomonas moolapensis 8.8.11]